MTPAPLPPIFENVGMETFRAPHIDEILSAPVKFLESVFFKTPNASVCLPDQEQVPYPPILALHPPPPKPAFIVLL